ncbi:hypothetical protein T06_11863 [Trichinella sp. T6]|nr:hypothetical protein T06_11863 [Trichinella sp. T6]
MYGQKLACGQLKVHVSYWKDDFRKMTLSVVCLVDIAPNEFVCICGDAGIRIHFDVTKPRYRRQS